MSILHKHSFPGRNETVGSIIDDTQHQVVYTVLLQKQKRSARRCLHRFPIRLLLFILLVLLQFQLAPTQASQAAGLETLVGIVGKDFVLLMADSSASQNVALTASNVDKIATLSDPFPKEEEESRISSSKSAFGRRQLAIAAAAAGNAADSDRLLDMLRAYATMEEYQNGWGSDVEVVPCDPTDNFYGSTTISRPGMSVDDMAHFARRMIADALRQGGMQVCLLIAGMKYRESGRRKPFPEGSKERFSNTGSQDEKRFPSQLLQQQTQQAWGVTSSKGHLSVGEEQHVDATSKHVSSSTGSRYEPRLYWLDEYGSLQQVQYGAHGMGANFLLSILDRQYHNDMTLDDAIALANDCFRELRTRYLINSPQPPCLKYLDANGIHLVQQDNDNYGRKH